MKCKNCNRKVFRNIEDEQGRIGTFRMCVSCNTLHDFVMDYRVKRQQDKIRSKNKKQKI